MKKRKNSDNNTDPIIQRELFAGLLKKADIDKSAFFISPSFDIERELLKNGHKIIAGIDEAGRGALAGPLAVGIAIYNRDFIKSYRDEPLKGINDSKKLRPGRRVSLYHEIKKHTSISQVYFASNTVIDRTDVNLATESLIVKFIKKSPLKPDIIIIDGNFSFNLDIPAISIPKGDSKSISIASASILAKVSRDRVMDSIDNKYPYYGLNRNKGYGTKKHIRAIYSFGYSGIHRKSFDPVKSMIMNKNQLKFDYCDEDHKS